MKGRPVGDKAKKNIGGSHIILLSNACKRFFLPFEVVAKISK